MFPFFAAAQAQGLLLHLERWLNLTKVLRRLIIFGHSSDARSLTPVAAVASAAPALLSAAQAMVSLRPAAQPKQRPQLLAMLDRAILKTLKTLTQVRLRYG